MRLAVLFAGLLISTASCNDNKARDVGTTPISSVSASSSASSNSLPAAPASPTLLAIRDAAKCPWIEDKDRPTASVVDPSCQALKNWESNLETLGKAAEGDLLSALDDSDRVVRWIAAMGLIRLTPVKTKYQKDKAISGAILKRARDEKDPAVGRALGFLVGRISLESTKLTDAVLDILRKGPEPVRLHMLDDLLTWNGSVQAIVDEVQNMARNPGPAELRSEAIRAIAAHVRDENMCKLMLDLIRDSEPEVAGQAAYQAAGAAGTDGCPKGFGDVLTEIENRLKNKGALHQGMAGAAGRITEQSTATAAQKQQALSILRKIVETKTLEEMLRVRALDILADRDPAGRSFATKFKNDDSMMVKMAAERALEKK